MTDIQLGGIRYAYRNQNTTDRSFQRCVLSVSLYTINLSANSWNSKFVYSGNFREYRITNFCSKNSKCYAFSAFYFVMKKLTSKNSESFKWEIMYEIFILYAIQVWENEEITWFLVFSEHIGFYEVCNNLQRPCTSCRIVHYDQCV